MKLYSQRVKDLVKKVMKEMEKREFTFEETEAVANHLASELHKNSERFAEKKTFAIFKCED